MVIQKIQYQGFMYNEFLTSESRIQTLHQNAQQW